MAKVRYKRPKRNRPGRRIYRTGLSAAPKRRTLSSAVRIVLGILCLAVLVFVGYSIGAPIQKYISEKKAEKDESSKTSLSVTTPYSTDDGLSERLPQTTPAYLTESTETEPPAEPAASFANNTGLSEIRAGSVELSAMDDMTLIEEELDRIADEGCNAAVFTLKDKGGDIYFNIGSSFASFAGGDNIRSSVFADEFVTAAENAGLIPIAEINLLEDYYSYSENSYGSYKDENGTVWTNSDGNSMLSPYDENTLDYISDIASETAEGGFDYIIISGVVFPDFETEDYNTLGEALAFGDRFSALVRAANTVYRAADKYGCKVILKENAADIIAGDAEALHPDELLFDDLCVVMDGESLDDVRRNADGMNIIPAYVGILPDDAENYIKLR